MKLKGKMHEKRNIVYYFQSCTPKLTNHSTNKQHEVFTTCSLTFNEMLVYSAFVELLRPKWSFIFTEKKMLPFGCYIYYIDLNILWMMGNTSQKQSRTSNSSKHYEFKCFLVLNWISFTNID